MVKTKFKPFIKCFVAVAAMITVWAFICVAIFTPYGDNKTSNETVQPTVLPEPTAAIERVVLAPLPVVSAAPVENTNPYANLVVTDAEKELLACMVYNEARGEPFEGQVAVVQVALNRYTHEAFDGSISDILLAPNQFSVGNTYGDEQMKAVEAALAGDSALDLNTNMVFFSTGRLTYGSYYKTICCHVFRTYERVKNT